MTKMRLLRVLVVLVGVAALFVMSGHVATVAAGGCPRPYVVQWGDTLYAIAQRFGTTVQTLARLNAIPNPNLIYAGQTLCLPVTEPRLITIETMYTDVITDGQQSLSLEPLVHTEFPLAPGEDGLLLVQDSMALRDEVDDDTPVIFWVTRPEGASAYILVSVGEDEPLVALRPEEGRDEPIEPLVPPGELVPLIDAEALSQPVAGRYIGSVTIWLVAPSGGRYPLPVAFLGHADTPADAEADFPDVTLALMRHGGDNYRAVMAVGSVEVLGPPHYTDDQRCLFWSGRSHWLYGWLSSWFGCPR